MSFSGYSFSWQHVEHRGFVAVSTLEALGLLNCTEILRRVPVFLSRARSNVQAHIKVHTQNPMCISHISHLISF